MQISKIFYFVLIINLILGKVTKFPVEKLSTSEVISKKLTGGWKKPQKTPPPVPLGLTLKELGFSGSGTIERGKIRTFLSFQPMKANFHKIGMIQVTDKVCSNLSSTLLRSYAVYNIVAKVRPSHRPTSCRT